MAKIEYKDVPIYVAHLDEKEVPTATQTAIDSGDATVTANFKSADDAVESWVSNNFARK